MSLSPCTLSGGISPRRLPHAAGVVLVGGWVLGFLYDRVLEWTRIDFVHTFAAILIMLALGAVSALAMWIGQVRSVVVGGLVGIATGAAASYFAALHWVHDLHPEHPYLFAPRALWDGLAAVYARGQPVEIVVSRVFEPGTYVDYQVPASVYFTAGIFVFGGLSGVVATLRGAFYCERCHAWLERQATVAGLDDVDDPAAAGATIEGGDLLPLLSLAPAPEGAPAVVNVELHACASEPRHAVISAEREERPEKGSPRRKRLFAPQWVDGELLDRVRARLDGWKTGRP